MEGERTVRLRASVSNDSIMTVEDAREEEPNDDDPLRAKLRTLHAWLAKAVRDKNVAVPDDTVGVLELYLDAGEATARRVMLVESTPDPR